MRSEQALERIRGSKVLSIQDYDRIQPIDRGGWAQVDAPLTDYDRAYPERLRESLGLELVLVRSDELIQEIRRAEREETTEIADMWMEEAEEVTNVTREDVIRSAELYVAYKALMKRYDADAITVSSWALIPDGKIMAMPPLAEMELAKELVPCCCESLIDCVVTQVIVTYLSGRPGFAGDVLNTWGGLVPIATLPENLVIVGHCYGPINPHGDDRIPLIRFMHYEEGSIPAQGLPSSQFCTDGMVATSETLVDSLVTQQLGLWMTGSTGFNGDYIIDVENGKAYIGHCECPLNPYGDERRAPYVIRNLPQWPAYEQEKGGACVQVNLPADGLVTLAKVSVHDTKMAVFAGQTVAGERLFPGWNDLLCRTTLAIRTDAKALIENLDWKTFGNHRVAFYGDHRQEFKDLATLMGFEVIMDVPGG